MENQNCWRVSRGSHSDEYYVPSKWDAIELFCLEYNYKLPTPDITLHESGFRVRDLTERN